VDTTTLDSAYARFYEIAQAGRFNRPADEAKWPAECIVAHIVATDQLLAATLTEVLEGRAPHHDNRPGIRTRHLEAIVSATADWPGLTRLARQSGAAVRSLVAEVGPDHLARVLPVFLQSGDQVLFDGEMALGTLLEAQAERHVPGHASQLAALRPR
jgi:hypothetical protein